jgi:hypothetical protein
METASLKPRTPKRAADASREPWLDLKKEGIISPTGSEGVLADGDTRLRASAILPEARVCDRKSAATDGSVGVSDARRRPLSITRPRSEALSGPTKPTRARERASGTLSLTFNSPLKALRKASADA